MRRLDGVPRGRLQAGRDGLEVELVPQPVHVGLSVRRRRTAAGRSAVDCSLDPCAAGRTSSLPPWDATTAGRTGSERGEDELETSTTPDTRWPQRGQRGVDERAVMTRSMVRR